MGFLSATAGSGEGGDRPPTTSPTPSFPTRPPGPQWPPKPRPGKRPDSRLSWCHSTACCKRLANQTRPFGPRFPHPLFPRGPLLILNFGAPGPHSSAHSSTWAFGVGRKSPSSGDQSNMSGCPSACRRSRSAIRCSSLACAKLCACGGGGGGFHTLSSKPDTFKRTLQAFLGGNATGTAEWCF